jgi:hypothetical protein
LNASIGFQASVLVVNVSVDLCRGVLVRRSYSTIEWSVAAETRMEVSVWLKAQDVRLFTAVGQARVEVGEELERVVSWMWMEEEAQTAKAGSVRWWDILVYGSFPIQEAMGVEFVLGVL